MILACYSLWFSLLETRTKQNHWNSRKYFCNRLFLWPMVSSLTLVIISLIILSVLSYSRDKLVEHWMKKFRINDVTENVGMENMSHSFPLLPRSNVWVFFFVNRLKHNHKTQKNLVWLLGQFILILGSFRTYSGVSRVTFTFPASSSQPPNQSFIVQDYVLQG